MCPAHRSLGKHQREGDLEFDQALVMAGLLSECLGLDVPLRYCLDKSAFCNTWVGCRAHRCPVPCQFICIPCMKMQQEDPALSASHRFKVAAASAEIDWCPRLHLPGWRSIRHSSSSKPIGRSFDCCRSFLLPPGSNGFKLAADLSLRFQHQKFSLQCAYECHTRRGSVMFR